MLAPRLPAICGNATLAIEVSSTSMNAASATVAAISHGLTRGFQAALASGFSMVVAGAVTPGAGGSVCTSGKNSLLRLSLLFPVAGNERHTRPNREPYRLRSCTQL